MPRRVHPYSARRTAIQYDFVDDDEPDVFDEIDMMVLSAPELYDNTMKTYYDVIYFGYEYNGPERKPNPYALRGNVASFPGPCLIV